MAAIASVTKRETGSPGEEIVRGTVTTTGDTYSSRLKKITHVFAHDETTTGGAKATFSGQTVTVTCTGGDVVDLHILGTE